MDTPTPYLAGAIDALTQTGLIKDAGVRDAVRTALTGRVPLRHGTSAGRAAAIRSKGLIPDAATGVSEAVSKELAEAQRGLAFTTRSPGTAKTYARQQQGLEAFEADPAGHSARMRDKAVGRLAFLDKGLGYLPEGPLRQAVVDGLAPARQAIEKAELNPLAVARALAPRKPAANSIVEMRVPRDYIAAHEAPSVEGRKMFEALGLSGNARKLQELAPNIPTELATELGALPAAAPFSRDVVLRGGVPSKYIKGAPDYQGVTLDELRKHLTSARENPRGLLKDVARSYSEVSHRPTKILGLDKAVPTASSAVEPIGAFGTAPPWGA